MAVTIKKALGIECVLIPKGRGIFDVSVDDVIIYSKYETGTYPEHTDMVETIREMKGRMA